MKYRKIKDKSASKSVKKLHDKIITIKKLFNSPSSEQFNLEHMHDTEVSKKEWTDSPHRINSFLI